uniref:G-protein coupled receptors family 1 profile domain-containing protein n=1 Tax=Strongyloides stercoralis TaxID=6248 RepID=A0A0K0EGI9_STRER
MNLIEFIDIILILPFIPTFILMVYTLCILIIKFKNKSSVFLNEFYPFVAYRIFTDILYNFLSYFFLKFPLWNIWPEVYLNNDILAAIMYSIGSFLVSGFFIHSLVVLVIRFIAIKYPTKYREIFSQKRIILIIIGMICYGTIIGSGTLFFKSRYIYNNVTNVISAVYLDKRVSIYTFAYGIVLYNLTIIFSLFFNIANWILIYKKRHEWKAKKSTNIIYAAYCFFTFIITCLHELYFILRVIGSFSGNYNFAIIANILLSFTGEIGTYGDFYFVLFISKQLRNAIISPIKKLFGYNIVEIQTVNKTYNLATRTKCIKV